MRIAIYGGSFNPPHVAHAMVASWIRWTGRADQVWLVPVFRHAFEGLHGKELVPFATRLAWCEAFAADVGPFVRVCDVEQHLPVPSYTIVTLRHLQQQHAEHELRLVVGADVLPQLPKWRDWAAIEREFSPIVVGRAGYAPVSASVTFPEVSSSEVRSRIAGGQPVDHLLTARVASLVGETWGRGV